MPRDSSDLSPPIDSLMREDASNSDEVARALIMLPVVVLLPPMASGRAGRDGDEFGDEVVDDACDKGGPAAVEADFSSANREALSSAIASWDIGRGYIEPRDP